MAKKKNPQEYWRADIMEYDLLKQNALRNRANSTDAEAVLWNILRRGQLGAKFRRQYIIDAYIVDFVCLDKRLVIEVDGEYHYTEVQQQEDKNRTEILQKYGFRVIRFTNEQVLYDTENVINIIKNNMETTMNNSTTLNSATQPVPPLSEGVRGRLGKALIVCAPSGTGKSTIINFLMEKLNGVSTSLPLSSATPPLSEGAGGRLHFSISATSRPPRGEEKDGVEYFFKSEEEFRRLIEEDAFIEYEEVFAGQLYGTLKSEVEKSLAAGTNLVFDVDIHGGLRIKEYFGERALSLFILPPSIEALRERLEKRGTETPEKIEKRLARAEYEISRAGEFDRQLVNDDLATAEAEAYQIVSEFLEA